MIYHYMYKLHLLLAKHIVTYTHTAAIKYKLQDQ